MGLVILFLLASALGACVHSAIYTSRVEQRFPPDGKTVEVNGTDMHVIRMGTPEGAPVLFIHGASANANEFDWSLAPRLEDRFDLILADRPGHGYSERPDKGAQLGVQARQMAGVLALEAGEEPAVVVGHSFGGAVALRLALDHPERVKALVLLAPVSHDWGGGGEAWYNSWGASPVSGLAFSQLVPIAGPGQARAGVVSTFAPDPVPEGYLENSAVNLLFRPDVFRANAQDVTALREELASQQDRYDQLTMPIVVFSGAEDTVINPTLHVGRLKHQAQNLELVKLTDSGHMPHHAHGEAVAEAIARLAGAR
ncbi:MAG: alpha/beta hydrolase [Hyphomonadaceae bacterium]|nr:alpha/beta hydrolase [Hyphomonadaceae bacterium]